jgi:hypothetical protein
VTVPLWQRSIAADGLDGVLELAIEADDDGRGVGILLADEPLLGIQTPWMKYSGAPGCPRLYAADTANRTDVLHRSAQ